MNRYSNRYVLAVCAALMFSSVALRAEDALPAPDKNKTPDQPKTQDRGRGGDTRQFGGRGNYTPGGGMDRMTMGNPFGGGPGNVLGMVSRMAGVDVEDPNAPPKIDQLPLGANKRLITQIPVGGVDNFNPTGTGWKMEAVFKLTPDKTKATDAVREEYAAEQKKLNQEIQDTQKALAAKVADLRTKYEKKANEILTGPDKDAKEKMDALAAEVYAKNTATVAETLPLYDMKDMAQGMLMVRSLREKTTVVTKDAEDKLMQLIPEANRPKFLDLMKAQAEQNNRQNMGGMGGFRNRGMGGPGGDGAPVAPPKAPEGDKF